MSFASMVFLLIPIIPVAAVGAREAKAASRTIDLGLQNEIKMTSACKTY
jgi:hypothetical protein